MLNITEITCSCHPVADMAPARKFYDSVPGLKSTVGDLPAAAAQKAAKAIGK